MTVSSNNYHEKYIDMPINEKPTAEQLIKRFAEVNGISEEEATQLIAANSEEEILKKIEKYTLDNIRNKMPPMNRAQRRALAKKMKNHKNTGKDEINLISDATKKINYINLIQQLRELNEKREKENNEDAIENN